MRFVRNPVTQFLLIGVLTVIGVAVGSNYLADDAALNEAIEETQRTTEVLASSVAEPALPDRLCSGEASDRGAVDRVDREILSFLLVNEVERVIIRDAEGNIIYSSTPALIGKKRALDSDHHRVLTGGGSGSEFSDSDRLLGPARSSKSDRTIGTYTQIVRTNNRTVHCCSRRTTRATRSTTAPARSSTPSAGSPWCR